MPKKNDFFDQDYPVGNPGNDRSRQIDNAKDDAQNNAIDYSYYNVNSKQHDSSNKQVIENLARSTEGLDDSIGAENKKKDFHYYWLFIKEHWKYFRAAAIFLTSALILFIAINIGISYVNNKYFAPVNASSSDAVEIIIKKGSSVSSIAKLLEEKGLIKNSTVFKFYVDFTDNASKIKAGTYKLSKNMTMDDIIDVMRKGDGEKQTVRFTIVEGLTVDQIAAQLVKDGILASPKKFIELANNLQTFHNYWFLSQITPDDKRPRHYNLEGYLFPDTYEIYVGATEEDIINKMLTRFAGIWQESYSTQAEAMGLTVDQVITMASMIQSEAKEADFAKVSAVFQNRLKAKLPLDSDATVLYALGLNQLIVTTEQTSVDSPYNTYKYKGLPVGSICNPGQAAIEAVLHPDEDMMKAKNEYYYFCLTDPKTGVLAFSKTLKEHQALQEKYKPLWGNQK